MRTPPASSLGIMKEYWLESQDCQVLIASLPLAPLRYGIIQLPFLGLSFSSALMTEEEWVITMMFLIFPVGIFIKLTLGSGVCSKLLPGFTKADASKATMAHERIKPAWC